MEHLFIPYELAVIAKEKGFDEPCVAVYRNGNYLTQFTWNAQELKNDTLAPVTNQIVDWFRQEHGIQLFIDYFYYDGFHYGYKWVKNNGEYGQDWKDNGDDCKGWNTSNEALIEGIKQILKLI